MSQSRRRQFLVAAGALLASPLVAEAQSAISRQRIAFFASDGTVTGTCTSDPRSEVWDAFLDGLRSFGYVQGQNITLECHPAESNYERLDALAREIVEAKPAVIVASAAPASLAAKRATSSIPIISVYTADPVGLGLVASFHRPGGNVTGLSALATDYVAKSLQLLKEATPRISRIGVIGHRGNPTFEAYRRELESAGRTLGLALKFGPVDSLTDIEPTFLSMRKRSVDAFVVMHQPFTFAHRQHFVDAATKSQLPTMYGSKEAVVLGGLISYAASVVDVYRRAAFFVDKILKGAKPADLPVEQPTKFELAINLKTAKALGVTIPQSLLLRADRVIE